MCRAESRTNVRTDFPPAGRRAVTHMCFMYGAHIMYGASTFAAPGAVTNVRNSFSAGGPAGRDAHVFYVRSTHNETLAHLPRRERLLM